jgi:succinyl-diaminopimelate desuccinylase
VLHFAAGEERGEPGTLSLLEAGFRGEYGITTEPTSLRVATATRGLATYALRIKGRSVHGSRPEAGINPIWALGPVLEMLAQYDAEVRLRPHPLLPGGSCTPTRVLAGVKENAVPDDCEILVDRRLLPGESAEAEMADLLERMKGLDGFNPELEYELGTDYVVEPAEISSDSPFVTRMLAAVGEVTGEPSEAWGAPFSSDVRNLVNDAGMTAVTFGPGDTRFCHCPDERVPIAELEQAAVSIAKVVTDLFAGGREHG